MNATPINRSTAWAWLVLPALLFLSGCCHDDCCDFCRACLDCSTPVHAPVTVTPPAPAVKVAPVSPVVVAPIARPAPKFEIAPARNVVYASQNETNVRD
jgi:hypothetical protein